MLTTRLVTSPGSTLDREIRALVNSIRNDMSTRLNHPTYGVTKAALRDKFCRLEGLLIAHRILFSDDCPPNPGAILHPYAMGQGVDLNALWAAIRAS